MRADPARGGSYDFACKPAFAFPVEVGLLPGDENIGQNMTLSVETINTSPDDQDLLKLLCDELNARLPDRGAGVDALLDRARNLPIGLRAMAMTFQLDVSISLDDLGWHFANWHDRSHCDATIWGLRELAATEYAEIFEKALALALPYWDKMGELLAVDFTHFTEWYPGSKLEKELEPLNSRLWRLQEIDGGLLGYWPRYARAHSDRIVGV